MTSASMGAEPGHFKGLKERGGGSCFGATWGRGDETSSLPFTSRGLGLEDRKRKCKC